MSDALVVRSLMHSPPVVLPSSMTVVEASRYLAEQKVGAGAVVDNGELVGIISERDVLRSVSGGVDPKGVRVADIMTRSPVTVREDAPVKDALAVFREHRFRHIPAVDAAGKVTGILSMRHLVPVANIVDVKVDGTPPEMAPPGLEGVKVAETSIGDVRGEEGFFHYRGYNAVELARHCSFEQVWYLLLEGHLPSDDEVAAFHAKADAARRLPEGVAEILDRIAALPRFVPLEALRSAVSVTASVLGLRPTLDIDAEECRADALRMAAVVPTLLMYMYSRRNGVEPAEPEADLGYAGNYLKLLTGKRPTEREIRAIEKYLILTMDHGFNSSTFTARVITSTGSDMGSALTGAIGALAGPLHGGAPSRALDMLDAIGSIDKAEAYLREEIGAGRRLMGFGHRVYKTDDPRSLLLREVALELGGEQAQFAEHVETTALAVLNELKPGRKLYTNVEFYAGVVMNTVGIPRDMFTPTFACSRTVGWSTAVVEQAAHNRLIRPSAVYVGPSAPRPLPEGYRYR